MVFNGEFVPGNQWVSPEHPYYQKAFPVPKRDLAKAKALLKEAGVTLPVAVDFMVPKGAENEAVAQVIQSMAAKAGFDMKIRVTEFATSLKQAEAGEYQAFLIGWSGRIDPDGNSSASTNQGAAKLQRPLQSGGRQADRGGARRKRWRAQGGVREDRQERALRKPIVYLYHRRLMIAHTARLEGYKPIPDGLRIGLT